MDFRSLLQSMNTIAEGETKETEKGRVHKGEYGNKYGKEDVRDQYGHKIGKVDKGEEAKKDAPKKGRGRPKKDTGDAGVKFDTSHLAGAFGSGKKPSKPVGTVSKKHSLKEYIEEVELSKTEEQLDEAMFPGSKIGDKLRSMKQSIGHSGSAKFGMAMAPAAGAGAAAGAAMQAGGAALFAPALGAGALGGAAAALGGFLTYKGLNWLAQKLFGTKEEALEFATAHLKAANAGQPQFTFQGKTYPVKVKSPQEARDLYDKVKNLQSQVSEQMADEDITLKPMPGASQIVGDDGKVIGTADAQTANQIKQAAQSGKLNLTGEKELDVNEQNVPLPDQGKGLIKSGMKAATQGLASGFDPRGILAPVFNEDSGTCNHTMEGEYCPEHGLAECGNYGMYESELARLKSLASVTNEGWKGTLAGSAAGGIAGDIAGKAIGPAAGAALGGALGGPAGAIAGGLAGAAAGPAIGSAIGGLAGGKIGDKLGGQDVDEEDDSAITSTAKKIGSTAGDIYNIPGNIASAFANKVGKEKTDEEGTPLGKEKPGTGQALGTIGGALAGGSAGAMLGGALGKAIDETNVDEEKTDEKAPPGAKAERMVKHIKAGYAKDGKLTPREKAIAYATAWKAHNKGKVEESIMLEDGTILTEGAMKDLVIRFIEDLENGPRGYNIGTAVELKDKGLAQRIIDKTLHHGDRYKRLAGTLKGQLRDAALEEFGFVNYEESLEEADITPGESDSIRRHTEMPGPTSSFTKPEDPMAMPRGTQTQLNRPVPNPTPFKVDPIAATTDRAVNFLSSLKKKSPFSESEQNMKDMQVESWEKQLNNLLTEGITVSSSTGQQGSPDSVSITATDNDAQSLMSVLRNAGIGGFGAGEEKPEVGYGVTSQGEEEPTGTGTEPQPSPTVVGDGDDMMALIKKMTGIEVGGDEGSEDYADEEGEEEQPHTLEPAGDEDDHDEEHDDSDEDEESGEEEEKTDEGNAFTDKLAQTKQGEQFKMGDKTYTDKSSIEEDEMEEGNLFTDNLAKARAAGKSEADLDGDGDMEKVHEGEDTCMECGMYESRCECDHEQVEEAFANEPGQGSMGDKELMQLRALLSMGNDLHKMKHSQTVGNPTQVSVAEALNDWKKLSGIK